MFVAGHIPGHILGDMWCQQWDPIEDLLLPYPDAGSVDVTDELIVQVPVLTSDRF